MNESRMAVQNVEFQENDQRSPVDGKTFTTGFHNWEIKCDSYTFPYPANQTKYDLWSQFLFIYLFLNYIHRFSENWIFPCWRPEVSPQGKKYQVFISLGPHNVTYTKPHT